MTDKRYSHHHQGTQDDLFGGQYQSGHLMPSLVAKQQRTFQPIPTPRSSHAPQNHQNPEHRDNQQNHNNQFDQDGLILPKRLPQNPNLVMLSTATNNINSSNNCHNSNNNNNPNTINQNNMKVANNQNFINNQHPIIRDLNRELKFNQIRGKDVLHQKSELKRVQEKMAEARRRKEQEQERLNRRSSLELRLEERAQKIANDGQAIRQEDKSYAN